MKTIINSIQVFILQVLVVSIFASGICLLAGEVRLATLRKASQGSAKLSGITQQMTKLKFDRIIK